MEIYGLIVQLSPFLWMYINAFNKNFPSCVSTYFSIPQIRDKQFVKGHLRVRFKSQILQPVRTQKLDTVHVIVVLTLVDDKTLKSEHQNQNQKVYV